MSIGVDIFNRNFYAPLALPRVEFIPQRYGWDAMGGPDFAVLSAWGSEAEIWELVEWLRAPIELTDQDRGNEKVWWGYIEEIRISLGRFGAGVSIKPMSNRIAVAYSDVPTGTATVGNRATTAWVQDDDSVAEYGTKEFLSSMRGATSAQAEAMRDRLLNERKYPAAMIEMESGGDELSAEIVCRGFFDMFGWRYYTNTETDSTVTTQQIVDIEASVGEFVTGVSIENASGISSSEYRDGDSTALDEILDLLATGVLNGNRLLAEIQSDRNMRVSEEPDKGDSDYFLDADGRLYDGWSVLMSSKKPTVGVWAKLKDVIPASVDISKLSNPSPIFIERAVYEVERDLMVYEQRGPLSPWQMMEVEQG